MKDNALTGADVDESTLASGGIFTTRFWAGNSDDFPNSFGPIAGFLETSLVHEGEGPVQMVLPDVDLVASDMHAYFELISDGGSRRLVLRVSGDDTALACEATANFDSATCEPAAGTTVPIPAGSTLAWKADGGTASGDTAGTAVSASIRLTPAP